MQQFPRLRAVGAALRRFAARLKDFPGDRRGSAVVYVAVIAVPLVSIVGVSIDAARGYLVKSKLSQALDAAGLAGGRVALSDTRDADIRMYFQTNFPPGYMDAALGTNDPQINMDANAEELTLSATATIPTTFMRILGHNDMTVRASNVIHRTVKGMELALVMDNTGSMSNNSRMTLMKAAATDLVNILFGSRETAPNFWISLIPYVAIVNIGDQRSAWTYTPSFSSVQITSIVSRKTDLSNDPDTWRVLVTTATDHGFYNGQIVDIAGVTGINNGIYNGRFMIRTTEAGAPTSAPYSNYPLTLDATTQKSKNQFVFYIDRNMTRSDSTSFFPISGFSTSQGTDTAGPPATVSGTTVTRPQYAYPAGQWKGCVEARTPTDNPNDPQYNDAALEAGNAEATPSTRLWRRSYWPSTLGVRFYSLSGALHKDGSGNPRLGDNQWGSSTNETSAAGNSANGPNLGCGPAITSLQPYKQKALDAIAAMAPWSRGGTMANLGLAWGWRVLSPEWRGLWGGDTPASYPLDYNSALVDKVVVLLTDGTNEWYDWDNYRMPGCAGFGTPCPTPAPVPTDADYTAYDRLAAGRVGTTDRGAATTEINTRMSALCTAMKAKGIIIYTIVVEVTNTNTQTLYSNCATKPEFAFIAPSASDLTLIFREIATQLTNLRLAR